MNCMRAVVARPANTNRTGCAPSRRSSISGDKQEHIPPFAGLPGGGIAMNCPICKGLEEVCESRISEYVKARSAAYYQVSTELAAYKNVEMERAKGNWEEHQLVCGCAAELRRPGTMPLHPPAEHRRLPFAHGPGRKAAHKNRAPGG